MTPHSPLLLRGRQAPFRRPASRDLEALRLDHDALFYLVLRGDPAI